MARAKYISKFERDMIRIGHAHGVNAPSIARFLGRSKVAVYKQIERMTADGTIEDLPFAFVSEEITRAMRQK